MTQSTTTNSYTLASMNSTSVYNYLKRIARSPYHYANRVNIDCIAEAFMHTYGDDRDVAVANLKRLLIAPQYITAMDFREMECEVITSLKVVPLHEAHVD